MSDFCEVCGSESSDGCPNGHEQSTYNDDRERLIALMQDAMRDYLDPITDVSDNTFIRSIIYFLDSEEHGTNVVKPSIKGPN
jgi:hypothetical protein